MAIIQNVGNERPVTDGSFKDFRFHVAVPTGNDRHGITSVDSTNERRLQVVESALVDGARVGDYGAKAETHNAEIIFFGPGFIDRYYQFKKVLNEGTPGKLVLPSSPQAVWAMFQRANPKSDGDSITVSISWIEANDKVIDQVKASTIPLPEAANKAKSAIEKALSVTQDNIFIQGVKKAQTGISAARSKVNGVYAIGQKQRSSIVAADARVRATLKMATLLVDDVTRILTLADLNIFKSSSSNSFAGLSAKKDPETGQPIVDFNSSDDAPVVNNPLVVPDPVPEIAKDLDGIQTEAGADLAISKVVDSITEDSETILDASEGRTDDVARSVRDVVNALQGIQKRVQAPKLRAVITPIEMSLYEVLFSNGISPDLHDEYARRNTHLFDTLVIPRNEVVYL